MVWAYVGPQPVPELPRYDAYVMDGVRDIGHTVLPCNWLQIMENSVDPYHVEALHGNYFEFIAEYKNLEMPGSFSKNKHEKVAFDPFEHGIIKRRVLEGQSEESDDWKIGHPLVFPYKMWVGGNGLFRCRSRSAGGRHSHHAFSSFRSCAEGGQLPDNTAVRELRIPVLTPTATSIDFHRGSGHHGTWVNQGEVADRTAEKITRSDVVVWHAVRMFPRGDGSRGPGRRTRWRGAGPPD